jgi:DNA-binding MarR family transcriptional regulator
VGEVDLAERLARLLPAQRTVATALGRVVERATGLTPVQAATVLAIRDGARRASEVARETSQHPSGASRVIESLVQLGVVDRDVDPEDRRAVVLTLTEEGSDRADAIMASYQEALRRVVDAMPRDVTQDLLAGLETFLDLALEALATDQSAE